MKMDVLSKNVEKITLKEAMTLEEMYDLMKTNSEKLPEKFKLKKGILKDLPKTKSRSNNYCSTARMANAVLLAAESDCMLL